MEESQIIRIGKALSDPTRFRILSAISGQEEIRCSELVALFPIKQATVSHHLKVLTDAGLIESRNEGSSHYFRLNRPIFYEYTLSLMGLSQYAVR